MAKNVRIENIDVELVNIIKKYTEAVTKGIEQELDKTSKALLSDIKANSPVKTGKYRKGWTCKKESSGGFTKYTIYNKDRYWLVHLLEMGHAKKGGGRVAGRPHVRPAADAHISAMNERINWIIQNGE